jgi:hypothetical protein
MTAPAQSDLCLGTLAMTPCNERRVPDPVTTVNIVLAARAVKRLEFIET